MNENRKASEKSWTGCIGCAAWLMWWLRRFYRLIVTLFLPAGHEVFRTGGRRWFSRSWSGVAVATAFVGLCFHTLFFLLAQLQAAVVWHRVFATLGCSCFTAEEDWRGWHA